MKQTAKFKARPGASIWAVAQEMILLAKNEPENDLEDENVLVVEFNGHDIVVGPKTTIMSILRQSGCSAEELLVHFDCIYHEPNELSEDSSLMSMEVIFGGTNG